MFSNSTSGALSITFPASLTPQAPLNTTWLPILCIRSDLRGKRLFGIPSTKALNAFPASWERLPWSVKYSPRSLQCHKEREWDNTWDLHLWSAPIYLQCCSSVPQAGRWSHEPQIVEMRPYSSCWAREIAQHALLLSQEIHTSLWIFHFRTPLLSSGRQPYPHYKTRWILPRYHLVLVGLKYLF